MSVAVKENLKENLKEKLFEICGELSVEYLAEVIDFAEFLREKEHRKQNEAKPRKERVGGLLNGQIKMSEDFTNELPDEFWFGADFGLIKNNNETAD